MNKLPAIKGFPKFDSGNIKEIIDLSDDFSADNPLNKMREFYPAEFDPLSNLTRRMRIIFNNEYSLSVIHGGVTHGSEQGLFELAAFNLMGDMDDSLFDKADGASTVLGYCSVDKVKYYVNKIGSIKPVIDITKPKQLDP